jgi:four helix bundle protein
VTSSFRDLEVWSLSMELVEDIYRVSANFPTEERFGLTAQMRRAAVSVPSCIAEGHDRHTTREYVRFVGIAAGSLAELRTQLEIAMRLNWIATEAAVQLERRAQSIARMLSRLRQALESKLSRQGAPALNPDL